MKFCATCGTQLDDDSAFCHACGASVENADENTDESSPLNGIPESNTSQEAPTAPANPTAVMPASLAASSTATASSPVVTAMPQATSTPVDSGRRIALIVGIAAVVVIAALLLIFLVVLPNTQEKTTLSISYETDGGTTIASQQVEEGELVTSPANPTKDGFLFEGWFTDAGLTQQATFPLVADKDLILYAKWSERADDPDSPPTPSSVDINVNVPSGGYTVPGYSGYATPGSTVSISIVGSDGTTRTANIRRQGSSQRVLPDGNSRRYSASELSGLSDAERCIAWNEIIAASNGYAFKNSGLAAYFNSCSWYHRVEGASAGGALSANAQANVNLLQSMTDNWWMHLAMN